MRKEFRMYFNNGCSSVVKGFSILDAYYARFIIKGKLDPLNSLLSFIDNTAEERYVWNGDFKCWILK